MAGAAATLGAAGSYYSYGFAILLLIIITTTGEADGRKLVGSAATSERHINYIDDPSNFAIDFDSAGLPGPDGTVCVERKKYIDKTEKDQLKECFVQNVTQCYYTYITEYSEAEQEKCVDFYWKTCKIIFKERVFNATTRMCKRPLIKRCDSPQQDKYGAPSQNQIDPKIVCETFYETACNTTDVVPAPGDEPLPVTFCDKIPRKICAPDNCRVVEDAEICEISTDQSTLDEPIELCDLQPQKHCSQVKIAVPRLVPEKKCRQAEKEICNTQLVNPHEVKKPVFIKYCTKKEKVKSANSYLPPPPPLSSYKSANPPPPVYAGPPPPAPVPVYSSPAPSYPRSAYGAPSGSQRLKRDPVITVNEVPTIVIEPSSNNNNNAGQSWTKQDQKDIKSQQGSWSSNSRSDDGHARSGHTHSSHAQQDATAKAAAAAEYSKRASRSLKFDEDFQHQQEKVPKQQGSWSNSRSDEGHAHSKSQKAFKNAQFDSDDSPWSPVTKAAVHN